LTTVVVSGALANKPSNGGNAWVVLSWALGLRRLGFHVYLLEQICQSGCVDSSGNPIGFADSANLTYFRQVTERFGLNDSAALILEDGEQIAGLSSAELNDVVSATQLLINISGHLTYRPGMQTIDRKVYLDLDPGYTQFWHVSGNEGARLAGHDFYFTVGENIGTPICPIPAGDIDWRHTRQPVVLEQWPVGMRNHKRFTTVASWRGAFGRIEYEGRMYGLKAHEFRKVASLPERVPQSFEVALDIHPADEQDRSLLQRHGWQIVDPMQAAAIPDSFRKYVQGSGAEFSVAQGVYVDTNSGWFSDRTVRYLASGKPVLVQDTGFGRSFPVGEGLLSFRTLQEAEAGAKEIARNYEHHCRAARALAEEYFDSDRVLGRLLDDIGVAP
jgi:hypothetical protein